MVATRGKILNRDRYRGKVVKSLSMGHRQSLIGFHVFTGTNITGRFSRISKEFCTKVFLELEESSAILKSLALLGTLNTTITELEDNLHEFVCLLYKNKSIKKLPDLRWYLFSTKNEEGENLPPTVDAMKQHILR